MRRVLGFGLMLAGALAGGCGDTKLLGVLPPGAQVDTFTQVSVAKVDILWVVDDSGSMADKQQNIANNFSHFFQHLQDAQVDYHVAVTTTDTTPQFAGQLRSASGTPLVITSTTPDPVAAFQKNVLVGTAGSALEKGLDAARLVLQLPPSGFLRTDAHLFIIFVADEDDSSFPGDAHFFYRLYSSAKGKGNEGMVLAGAIIGKQPNGCYYPTGGEAKPGVRYEDVVQLMNGQVGSLCDADFSSVLDALGLEAVGLQRRFKLSQVPDPTTIKVTSTYPCTASPTLLNAACSAQTSTCSAASAPAITCTVKQDTTSGSGTGWYYDMNTNALVFDGDAIPTKGTTVEVLYYEPGKKPNH